MTDFVQRFDFNAKGSVRFDLLDSEGLDKPIAQPDGSVIYTGRVARTGPHQYPWGTERRDATELKSIVSQLRGTPVTIMHPNRLLSAGGQARIAGKVLSGARVDGVYAIARLQLDPEGVSVVKAGIRELSLGYSVKAVNGNHTNTRVDHLALVLAARCGESCAVRTDHAVRLDCAGTCDCRRCDNRFTCSRSTNSLGVQTINQLTVMRGK